MLRGLVLALLFIEGVAWADDPLAQARRSVAESDYVGARPQLAAALGAGGHDPEELVEIYRLTGIVDAALGDTRAATDAFTRLLALSPKATLPAGTSPKIKRPFDAAGRYFQTHAPLEVKLETSSTPPTITLVLVSDPLHMIARAHAVFAIDGGIEQTRDVIASERTDIALPAGRRIDARVSARDVHGNHLVKIGSKDVPIVIVGEAPPAPPEPPPVARPPAVAAHGTVRPLYLRWWPYAAAAAVFTAGAGYFAWSVRADTNEFARLSASPREHPFDELKAVEDRGRRHVLFTNVGLGAAGVFAIAAGVMYIVTPRHRTETRVTAVPVPGGGMMVLGGSL